MARPREGAYEDSAKGKIESAFWRILEKEGFHAVTMSRLSRETGLNRNTVYYHFLNVEEVAQFAFRHIFTDATSKLFVSVILSGREITSSVLADAELLSNIKKFHLFARSGSPMLTALLKDSLREAWFFHMGISPESLTPTDEMQIEYILSGFIGLIGNRDFVHRFPLLKSFPRTLIGSAAIDTLKEIAAATHRSTPPKLSPL